MIIILKLFLKATSVTEIIWKAGMPVKELPSLERKLKKKNLPPVLTQNAKLLKVERAGHVTHFVCFCSSEDWIWGLAQARQIYHWAVISASSNIFVWGVPTKKERTCFHSFPESLPWLDSPQRDYKTQCYFCLSKADWTGVPKALTFLLAVYNSSASSAPKPCVGYGTWKAKRHHLAQWLPRSVDMWPLIPGLDCVCGTVSGRMSRSMRTFMFQ